MFTKPRLALRYVSDTSVLESQYFDSPLEMLETRSCTSLLHSMQKIISVKLYVETTSTRRNPYIYEQLYDHVSSFAKSSVKS